MFGMGGLGNMENKPE